MQAAIGPYQILAELGRGGMGVVYKAFDPQLQRPIAVKLMGESIAHEPGVAERFLREARSMARISSTHVVQVHFIGDQGGRPFFAMEFVDGVNLSQLLEQRIPDIQETVRLVRQSAQGLAAAHDAGVIHRDIKPANLILSARGVLKITDFGIALAVQDGSAKLTKTGAVVGTPGYLSPEVCLAHPVDARSDVFSLGVVMFELLAGRLPYQNTSPYALMLEIVQAQIPDVRSLNEYVDATLAGHLSRMLAKDPNQRFQNLHDLDQALAHWEQQQRYSSPEPEPTPAPTMVQRAPAPARLPAPPPIPPIKPPPSPVAAQYGAPAPPLVYATPSAPPMEALAGDLKPLGMLTWITSAIFTAAIFLTLPNVALLMKLLIAASQENLYLAQTLIVQSQQTSGLGIVQLLVGLSAIVVYCVWQYRAHTNARILSARPGNSVALGVVWWFVPVANLFMPFVVLRDIDRGSRRGSPRFLVAAFALVAPWSLALSSFSWSSLASNAKAMTTDIIAGASFMGLIATLMWIVGGAMAIFSVHAIARAQSSTAATT